MRPQDFPYSNISARHKHSRQTARPHSFCAGREQRKLSRAFAAWQPDGHPTYRDFDASSMRYTCSCAMSLGCAMRLLRRECQSPGPGPTHAAAANAVCRAQPLLQHTSPPLAWDPAQPYMRCCRGAVCGDAPARPPGYAPAPAPLLAAGAWAAAPFAVPHSADRLAPTQRACTWNVAGTCGRSHGSR